LQPIEQAGVGLVVSLAASLVNLGVARVLLRAGQRYHSITLEADSRHLMTDVWTSAGVVVGVAAVAVTKWDWLDPVIALVVAANIIWSGVHLIRRSASGLLDTAIPAEDLTCITTVLEKYKQEQGISWHALRTRQAGPRRFVSLHVLVPDTWTVRAGHDVLEKIEADIRGCFPNVSMFTHLEPLGDPVSLADEVLDRAEISH
jgi:cation diffusion facilitator family transporter